MSPSKPKAFVRLLPLPIIFFLSSLAGGFLAPRCDGASPGFEETGSLARARAYHTATLLQTGKVLVAGDINGASLAELYDPATGTWAATGSLANGRYRHTATLLPNGKVLVVGGRSFFTNLASAELYDPASGTWTATGSLATARAEHTATLLPDGKVLVAGGFVTELSILGGFSLASAEIYDPASGTWTSTGSLATARTDHTATLLGNGKVLVTGGATRAAGEGTGFLASAELYDPQSGTWTATGSLSNARSSHTATLLDNGKVLAAGGDHSNPSTAELYDPQSGTWTATGSLTNRRSVHTATLLPSGKVLVAGGGVNSSGGALASAELYDPATGTWTATGSLVTGRRFHTATLLSDGTVLVAAGRIGLGGSSSLASAELYVKSTPTLLNISTRMHVLTGDRALIGGFIITGTEQKTVIVRGIGPSLPMPGTLSDPVIEVHGPAGELLGSNDNWKEAATQQQISDSGLAPSNDLESALWGVINPGAYTIILRGKDGGTGIGSVEVYDLDEPADSRLANVSTRGFVDTGDNVMIGGLIVGGGNPGSTAKVVVRALGPSLPVNGGLANPTVELHDENGAVVAFNDDWKTRPDGSSQQAEIEATTIPPSNDLESALVRRLTAGSYTAIVRGASSTSGIGLVEAYHLP